MNTVRLAPTHPTVPDWRHDLRLAWASLVLLPVSFFAAFGVGEGLMSALGYRTGFDTPPFWAGLLATVPALVVFAIPAAISTFYARRAGREGHRSGWIPAGFMLALVAFFVVLNTVPMGQ